jgi:hypothetical protein
MMQCRNRCDVEDSFHFIQFCESITRSKRLVGYRIRHNTLYPTLIYKFNTYIKISFKVGILLTYFMEQSPS